MVLRFDSNDDQKISNQEIYLVETTSNTGVRVKRWKDQRDHLGKFYQRIALRHLDFPRTELSLEKLEQFL